MALILEVVFITALWWNFDRGVKAAHMKINTTKSLIALHVVNLLNFASSFGDVEAMKLEGAFAIGVPILILIIIGLIAFLIKEDSADQ
ncbi:MAG: hypothetical protein IH840_16315 [Candidatus Heimdallarchaeota archaeon]|nr:hypothetical protein [Candidatus Heimdallarchaeota archaeon]